MHAFLFGGLSSKPLFKNRSQIETENQLVHAHADREREKVSARNSMGNRLKLPDGTTEMTRNNKGQLAELGEDWLKSAMKPEQVDSTDDVNAEIQKTGKREHIQKKDGAWWYFRHTAPDSAMNIPTLAGSTMQSFRVEL